MADRAAKPLSRSLSQWVSGAADALATLFLPAGCRLCDELLTRASRLPICQTCLASFSEITDPICVRCGLPLDPFSGGNYAAVGSRSVSASNRLCSVCTEGGFHFERARSFAWYKDSMVRAIVMLKFEEVDPLADWFADRLFEIAEENASLFQADLVVPVPVHRDRHRERGFNQAELLSRRLAKRLHLPHQTALLVRKRPRPDKHLLSSLERWEAVRGAFATRPGSQVDNQRVLLVDDVMTTGATLDACAKALRDAGASSVLGLTVARAVPVLRKFGPKS